MQHTLRFSSLAAAFTLFTLLLIPHSAHAATITVTMTDDQFTPSTLTVNAGDTVTWVNQGSMAHTVTADNGTFDSGSIQPAQQYSVTFNQAGSYAYHCKFHGAAGGVGMSGSITVVSGTSNTAGGTLVTNTNTNTNTNQNTNVNNAALYAQVQALLAQISALQAQNGGSGGTVPVYTGTTGMSSVGAGVNSSACPNIGRALSLSSTGDDVTRLQQFLARDPSVYPEAQVTGYYGSLTQAAVQRWQTKYNIVSSGTAASTGFGVVGPRTAAAISLQCSTMNGAGGTSGSGGTVGGYIQVTPITGTAPLSVNVNATVNTGGCGGATYTLDFGDGSAQQQIVVAGGNCSPQQQTYQHTYIYGGTYQVTLSAGAHTSSAQVTVSGPAAPASGSNGSTIGQERGTISAFTTSGNAPLNVTFYVSCAVGTAYNVVFGDGTDLGGTAVSGTKCGTGSLDSVAHTYTTAGSYEAQLIIFTQQSNGTIVPVTASQVAISVGSVSANYSYNPPQLSPGATQLAFNVQFDVPTACTGYDVSWGDGTADSTRADGGSSCAQSTTVSSANHTYAQTGQYTITVRRGANLARTDTIAVTVQ